MNLYRDALSGGSACSLFCFIFSFPQFRLTAAGWRLIEARDLARIIPSVRKILSWKLKNMASTYSCFADEDADMDTTMDPHVSTSPGSPRRPTSPVELISPLYSGACGRLRQHTRRQRRR